MAAAIDSNQIDYIASIMAHKFFNVFYSLLDSSREELIKFFKQESRIM